MALSEFRLFLQNLNIIPKELNASNGFFKQNTFFSRNLIGPVIYQKVQSFTPFPLEKLAEIFEASINKIAKQLEIGPLEGDNLLEKMNALIEGANDSSTKLNKTFSGWTENVLPPKDQTLRTAISELLQLLTYAQEIAKFDVEWNNKIIEWNAELKTLK